MTEFINDSIAVAPAGWLHDEGEPAEVGPCWVEITETQRQTSGRTVTRNM